MTTSAGRTPRAFRRSTQAVQCVRRAIDRLSRVPNAAGQFGFLAELIPDVRRRVETRGRRPERTRDRVRPVQGRNQPVEESLDRGPDPGKVWVFGSDSRGRVPDLVEVRANGVHPPFDPGQPRVRLGQALVQTGGDAGHPAGGLRRGPPAEANRRGAQQHADDPEHNGADAQSWSHEPTRNRIRRTQMASPGDDRDR